MRMLLTRAAAVLVVALIPCPKASAQSSATVPNAMQGFSQNRDQPVRIEAASLEMQERKKEATFAGNVKVVQGDTTMTSKTLVAYYERTSVRPTAPGTKGAPLQSDKPGPGGSSSIRRLVAKGSVMVVRNDQVVTGETAIFDTRTNLITMLGGVLLTHCKNVVRGDRLLVDMTTGVSRVESDSKVVALAGQGQDCGNGLAGSKPPGSLAPSASQSKIR